MITSDQHENVMGFLRMAFLNGVTLENRVEIYQMLCIMETEQSEETFHQLMSQFMQYWTPRETEFMTLFKTNYASRPGISTLVKKLQQ